MIRFGCSYDGRRKLINVDPFDDNIRVLLECNSACMCDDSCINRVVQHGLQVRLEIFNTEMKGFGARTLENIDKNTFVCEYTGELISSDQAKERRELQLSTSANYILCVNEYYGHTHEEIQATYIDATKKGNIGHLINHSCEPNLYMVPVKVNYMTSRMALFALKDIGVGEELSYDYSGNLNSSSVDQTDFPLKQHKKCFCGSLKCRTFLPFNLT